jgi:beta-phosphoglucomutase-like phosphatase (HAD superfamily)
LNLNIEHPTSNSQRSTCELRFAPPRALIFDCDGTLADTMPLHWQVWQTLLQRYGLQMSEERFYACGGVPSRDIARMLAEEQGVSIDPLTLAREKEEGYLDLLAHVAPMEIVVKIARAHAGQLPMAVASGGTRRVIEIVLNHLGIRDLFAAVVTNEDVKRQKPAPDIFLEAARRLGVPPQHWRAYEDTDLGLEAIRAAGMEAVDVRELLR